MKIAILTDAWYPQLSGVVITLVATMAELKHKGHQVLLITPENYKFRIPLPTYPEIRLPLFPFRLIKQKLREFKPDAIHIATEGTIGLAARRYCIRHSLPFTTVMHTRFAEYAHKHAHVPISLGYRFMLWFHNAATRTMVATKMMRTEMEDRGFRNLVLWSRGVDTTLFKPFPKRTLEGKTPIMLYLGRVSIEKNIEAFLKLDVPGSKYVVGDGPDLRRLKSIYTDVQFLGRLNGAPLAETIAGSDVMVFPSLTDTFGLVVLEANACGVPVACYPVQGPGEQIINGYNGFANHDLGFAVQKCLALVDREDCIKNAHKHTWAHTTEQFLSNLVLEK